MNLVISLMMFVGAATITPGGATALAMSAGMQFGVRGSVPLISGLVAGLSTMAAVAAFGLAELISRFPSLNTTLSVAATLYFLWLAYTIASSQPAVEQNGKRDGIPSRFSTGGFLLWLNPKAWTMTLGAAASFGEIAQTPFKLALVFGSVFALCSVISLFTWSYGGAFLARVIKTTRQWRLINFSLAAILISSIIPIWVDKF